MGRAKGWAAACVLIIGVLAAGSGGGCSGSGDTSQSSGGASHASSEQAAAQVVDSAGLLPQARARVAREDVGFVSRGAGQRAITLAKRADGSARLEASEGIWIEIAPALRTSIEGELHDGLVVFERAARDTDVVFVFGERSLEEHRVLRSPSAPGSASYALRLGPGLARAVVRHGRVEVVDRLGRVAFHTSTAVAVDAGGQQRPVELALDQAGTRLTVNVDVDGLSYPLIVDPSWAFGGTWPKESAQNKFTN